jgi:hypothetical protein
MGSGSSRPKNALGRRIALGVDRSPESMVAFLWLRANVMRPGDTVLLLHVHDGKSGAEEGAKKTTAPFEELCSAHAIQVPQHPCRCPRAICDCQTFGSGTCFPSKM